MFTRFAPAPTGWLHLGHVLNAEYVWRLFGPDTRAHAAGGGVLLRIEDHDRERCRPEFEAGILEDLDWLGYHADFPVVRQSERDAVYREAVAELARQRLVYACDCSRADIEARGPIARRFASADPQSSILAPIELRYDGHCRDRGLPLTDGLGWRVRMDPGVETFVDMHLGERQDQDPHEQCGDVLMRDRLGNWTYQFACAVDDYRQGIGFVIRGEDLLASTGRQIRIARLLGRRTPATFFHHALVMKGSGRKLSKSDGDTGVRDLRAQGWTPQQVKDAARAGRIISPL